MAKVTFTNPSSVNTVVIDSDRGDRVNRYTLFVVDPSSAYALDEADIMVPFDQAIPDSLKGGELTVVEADLNNYTDFNVKNFVASGLGIHYYESNGVRKANRAVVVDEATGKIAYVTTNGDQITGILRADTTNGQYERVVVTEGTSTTIELGGTVAEGDYLMSDTTGRALKATAGTHSFGTSPSAGSANDTKTITLSFKTVA